MQDGAAAAPAKTEEKKGTPGLIVSAGQVQKAGFDVTKFQDNGEVIVEDKKDDGDAGADDPTKRTPPADKKDVSQPADEPTEEQLKKYFEKNGIAYDGLETLKSKLAPAPKEKTEEEKKAEATAKEQRLLAAHMARGGTIEQFTNFQQLAAADPKVLGLTKAQSDLVKEGFTPEQAEHIIKQIHLQYSEEEIADFTPEQKALAEKQAAYGLKKQENRGKYLQNTAKSYLDSLDKEISEQDAEKAKAAEHTSKVEDALKNFSRKQTLQLGEYDGQKLDPVEFNVPDEVIQKVSEILKDPANLQKQLYNEDGSLNLNFLIPNLVASVSRENAVKTAYLTGGDKQVEAFKATFGETKPELGGQKKTKRTGQIVGYGQPEVIRRPQ